MLVLFLVDAFFISYAVGLNVRKVQIVDAGLEAQSTSSTSGAQSRSAIQESKGDAKESEKATLSDDNSPKSEGAEDSKESEVTSVKFLAATQDQI